jgi:hypothetical protein
VTFALTYVVAPRPAGPGELPTATATLYVDFDAVPTGVGTSGSPYNASQMPGLTAIDSTVQPGTHIKCKGTWRTTAGNFGRLLRAGTAARPVVYIFNDPTWGQGYIDGGVQLTPAACTNQANAFGNTNWASMRRASIVGLGGNDIADYLHCAYAGTEREPRYFAGYPQLANNDAFDYLQFAAPASWADVIWKPGSADPTQQSDFVAGTAGNQAVASRPRILLSAANTAMGLAAGTLEAAIDADSAPILVMRIYANKWYTARCRRCDADGTVNTSGLYLTPIIPLAGQACLVAGNATYTSLSDYAYRIFNLAKAIDRAGQYAMNPVDGWMLDWPTAAETLHRSRGNSGLRFGANYIWVHALGHSVDPGRRVQRRQHRRRRGHRQQHHPRSALPLPRLRLDRSSRQPSLLRPDAARGALLQHLPALAKRNDDPHLGRRDDRYRRGRRALQLR